MVTAGGLLLAPGVLVTSMFVYRYRFSNSQVHIEVQGATQDGEQLACELFHPGSTADDLQLPLTLLNAAQGKPMVRRSTSGCARGDTDESFITPFDLPPTVRLFNTPHLNLWSDCPFGTPVGRAKEWSYIQRSYGGM